MTNLTLQTNPSTGKRIILLNASALKYSNCNRRFAWTIGYGLGNHSSIAAEYGVAFHKYLATKLETGHDELGYAEATKYYTGIETGDDYRTSAHLLHTMMAYGEEYRYDSFEVLRDKDGHAIVEKSFAIDADDLLPAGSNYHLILVGTIDALGKTHNGYTLMDHKTTSVFKRDTYLAAYYTSVQLKFYSYVLRRYKQKFPEGFPYEFGCQINGIFLSKDPANSRFQRSDYIYFTDKQMDEFEQLIKGKLEELCKAFNSEPLPTGFIHDTCNSHFGLCPFFEGCSNPDLDGWLDMQEKKQYNPIEQ